MFVGHSVLVGHVVGGHVVDTEETDRLSVDADFVLPFENGGKLPFGLRLQPVNGYFVRQSIYKNAVFVEGNGNITVFCIKRNAEAKIVSLIRFFFDGEIRQGRGDIQTGSGKPDRIGGQIAILTAEAQRAQLAVGGIVSVNEFVGAAFYQHHRTEHGGQRLSDHIGAAVFIELRVVDGKAGNGGIVTQIGHSEPLHDREISCGTVENQICQETAVQTVVTDGLDQWDKAGAALIVKAQTLLTGRVGEHTVIHRKIAMSKDRLPIRYFHSGDIVQREELEFRTQSVQDHLVIVEERNGTGAYLGDLESMLAVERVGVGQGMAKLQLCDTGEVQLNTTAPPGQRHKPVAVVGKIPGAEHMESVVFFRGDPGFKNVAFIGYQFDGNHPGVFVGASVETQYIFTFVKGKRCFKGFVDVEVVCMPDQGVAKPVVGYTGDGGGYIDFFTVGIGGVRLEAVFFRGFGEIHPDLLTEAAIGEEFCQLRSGLQHCFRIVFIHERGTAENDQLIATVQKILGQAGCSGQAVLGAANNDGIILFKSVSGIGKRNFFYLITVFLERGNNGAVIAVVKGANERTFCHSDCLLFVCCDSMLQSFPANSPWELTLRVPSAPMSCSIKSFFRFSNLPPVNSARNRTVYVFPVPSHRAWRFSMEARPDSAAWWMTVRQAGMLMVVTVYSSVLRRLPTSFFWITSKRVNVAKMNTIPASAST